MMERRLNIGAGRTELPGFESWDIADGRAAYPLDLPDDSVAEIYASHVLEHYGFRDTMRVVREWVRVLQPGGRLRVAVPDADSIIRAYLTQTGDPVEAYLFGGQTNDHDVHRSMWNADKLERVLGAAGLVNVAPWSSEIRDCASLPVSLNRQGYKPARAVATTVAEHAATAAASRPEQTGPLPISVVAVLSAPRLGFLDSFHSILSVLPPLGIHLVRGMGAFWEQRMERILEYAIREHNPDAILALDYDTVFEAADVRELVRLFVEHPEAAAVVPLQWNRAADVPLWQIAGRKPGSDNPVGAAEIRAAGDLFRVDTGHFGLTLFRPAALQKMPHPWLMSRPNQAGKWDDGKIDADIAFWHQLNASGGAAYLAPNVVVGHAELGVRWPDRDMNRVVWQHMYDYNHNGRPAEAWGAGAASPSTTPSGATVAED